MTALPTYTPSDRYTENDGRAYLRGTEALARLPIAQLRADRAAELNTAALATCCGRSPLGGLDRELALAFDLVPDLPILARPVVDEELAATAVMGTQFVSTQGDANYEGVVGFWYGTAAGLGRAGDALRRANAVGTSRYGGAVAVVGDDPSPDGSPLLYGSDLSMIDLNMPMLHPGDVQEVLDLGRHAVTMSRLCGLWTAMRIVGGVAGGSGTAELAIDRLDPIQPNLEVDGVLHVSVVNEARLTTDAAGAQAEIRARRLEVARRYGVVNDLNRLTANPRHGWIGIVAAGYTYREVLEALRRLGFGSMASIEAAGIGLLCLQMPYPLDSRLVRNFARGLNEVIVVEERTSSVEWTVKDALYGGDVMPRVVGRSDEDGVPLVPADTMLSADVLVPVLYRRLTARLADRLAPPPGPEAGAGPGSVGRPPSPLWPSPPEARPTMDGASPAIEETGLQTGTGDSQWLGMEPFLDRDHVIENLGDVGPFDFGLQAIQGAVAAGVNMTYELAHGGTTATTGGRRSAGAMTVKELTRVLLNQGVTEVLVIVDDPRRHEGTGLPTSKYGGKTKVWDRARTVDARRYLESVPGVSVLIQDRSPGPGARSARDGGQTASRQPRLLIDHRLCEACGDCGDVDSSPWLRLIDTPFGVKTAIDRSWSDPAQPPVDGDCPSFIEIEPASGFDQDEAGSTSNDLPAPASAPAASAPAASAPAASAPAASVAAEAGATPPRPTTVVPTDRVEIRLAGTAVDAVTTVAHIIGTAALLDGWTVRGFDGRSRSPEPAVVISDLRLTRDEPAPSNLIGRAEADAIIAFDPASAASESVLGSASPERTVLVASTSQTPSAAAARRADHRAPTAAQLRQRAADAVSPRGRHFVDAAGFTTTAAESAAAAEIFLLGVAVQGGSVPVSCEAVERSIELLGEAVEARLSAFRLGRRWMFGTAKGDPEPVPQIGQEPAGAASTELAAGLSRQLVDLRLQPALHDLLTMLAADLVDYQNESYAQHFLDVMTRIVGAERLVASDSTELSETVGRGLHRLMAYKDEYEVARLLVRPEQRTMAEMVGGQGAKVTWKVRRPWSKNAGRPKKLSLSARRARPWVVLLARSKRLRGSALDPFGAGALRRAERSLIVEYPAAIDSALRGLDTADLDAIIELAASAMEVRGYGRLKMARIEVFRDRLARGVEVRVP